MGAFHECVQYIYMPGIMLEAVHVLSLVDITILPVVLRTASEVNSKAEI